MNGDGRARAIDVATAQINRQFGRGALPKSAPKPPAPRSRRKYRPKGERGASAAKATFAASRPRDAKGHFLPLPGSRRARIRAAIAGVPGELAGVTGTEETLLADLARSRG